MTELIQSPDATLTTVRDVTEELSLVAMNIDQMRVAQTQMSGWFRSKMEILRTDLKEAESNKAIALQNKWRSSPFTQQINRLTDRIAFYEKCALASEAGYCLIPNLPCDLFAVRVNKRKPDWKWRGDLREAATVRSDSPAAGDGRYIDEKMPVDSWDQSSGGNGGLDTQRLFRPLEFVGEIDFPMSICKPEIMNETSRAMALKVFDEFAVVDDAVQESGVNRVSGGIKVRSGDPLVIGIIRDPRRTKINDRRLTFLIGWNIDTRTL